MYKASAIIALAAFTTSGCVVYSDVDEPGPVVNQPTPNFSPYINSADAGCYYDAGYRDDIWYFEADVDDGNGPLDVVAVYADVYDGYTGQWVETFELYPTNNAHIWFSDWLGSSTWLDCYYRGYEVDIIAYDAYDAFDVLTVLPYTY
ncbi:MAG: hypothetical protein ACI8S6_005561 [Myxococcota bacterium]|jgi:hypothetical protein